MHKNYFPPGLISVFEILDYQREMYLIMHKDYFSPSLISNSDSVTALTGSAIGSTVNFF